MTIAGNQLTIAFTGPNEFRFLSGLTPHHDLDTQVATDRRTHIAADKIVVDSVVATKGQSITLVCRVLEFTANGRIDTSGRTGVPNATAGDRPRTPNGEGATGIDGADGGRGGNAGDVRIVAQKIIGKVRINASGGVGGRAGDGGHGSQGARGQHGVDTSVEWGPNGERPDYPPQTHGQQGKRGGAAGLPGRRGAGGAGGRVSIATPTQLDSAMLEINVAGGATGPAGDWGQPGEGGPPGEPGECAFIYCSPYYPEPVHEALLLRPGSLAAPTVKSIKGKPGKEVTLAQSARLLTEAVTAPQPTARPICDSITRLTGYRLGPGPRGDRRAPEIRARLEDLPITNGASEVKVLTPADFAKEFNGPFLELLTWSAEDAFRVQGARIDDALRARIEFLLLVSQRGTTPDPFKEEIFGRAFAMARKVSLGLDFFGYSREQVPQLAYESYQTTITTLIIPQLVSIEQAYQRYLDAVASKDLQRQAIRDSQQAARQAAIAIEGERVETTRRAKDLGKTLDVLEAGVFTAEAVLLNARTLLTQAVRNLTGDDACDIGTVIKAGMVIAAVIEPTKLGFLAVGNALANVDKYFRLHEEAKDLWENKSVLKADYDKIVAGGTKFKDGIEAIMGALRGAPADPRRLPRFEMERSQFDEIAKTFADMPEAAAYREAGYAFLKAVETRNQAITDFNAMLLRLIELQMKAQAAERIIDGLDSALAIKLDPAEPVVVSMLARLYLDSLSITAQCVHAERKALGFMIGTPAEPKLSAFSAATIQGVHVATTKEWIDAKEEQRKRPLRDDALVTDIVNLVDGPGSDAWKTFRETGAIGFSIRRDNPTYRNVFNLPGLRVTGVSMELVGARSENPAARIFWILTHGGHSAVYRRDKYMARFSHKPVMVDGDSDLAGGPPLLLPDFSEAGFYSGLSPFATWSLVIPDFAGLGLDLSGLTGAKLRWRGYIM
jgi:hypothetical protein